MSEVPIVVGPVFFGLGTAMIVFRRRLGSTFCKMGKHVWKDNPFKIPSSFTDSIYDERKAPRIMLFLGVQFAVQGVALGLMSFL